MCQAHFAFLCSSRAAHETRSVRPASALQVSGSGAARMQAERRSIAGAWRTAGAEVGASAAAGAVTGAGAGADATTGAGRDSAPTDGPGAGAEKAIGASAGAGSDRAATVGAGAGAGREKDVTAGPGAGAGAVVGAGAGTVAADALGLQGRGEHLSVMLAEVQQVPIISLIGCICLLQLAVATGECSATYLSARYTWRQSLVLWVALIWRCTGSTGEPRHREQQLTQPRRMPRGQGQPGQRARRC